MKTPPPPAAVLANEVVAPLDSQRPFFVFLAVSDLLVFRCDPALPIPMSSASWRIYPIRDDPSLGYQLQSGQLAVTLLILRIQPNSLVGARSAATTPGIDRYPEHRPLGTTVDAGDRDANLAIARFTETTELRKGVDGNRTLGAALLTGQCDILLLWLESLLAARTAKPRPSIKRVPNLLPGSAATGTSNLDSGRLSFSFLVAGFAKSVTERHRRGRQSSFSAAFFALYRHVVLLTGRVVRAALATKSLPSIQGVAHLLVADVALLAGDLHALRSSWYACHGSLPLSGSVLGHSNSSRGRSALTRGLLH